MTTQKFITLCITTSFIILCLSTATCTMHSDYLIAKHSITSNPMELSCAINRGDESRVCAMNQINK